jgi:hypothetical protein
MKNIYKYEDFINEDYIHSSGVVTDVVQLSKPNTAYKFSVVKKTARKHGEDYALHGAIRIEGPKGIKDYKIESRSPIYQGALIPSDFWESTKGEFYILKNNEGERKRIEPEDIKILIDLYNSEEKKKSISSYENKTDKKEKSGDLIFTLTSDWKNIK